MITPQRLQLELQVLEQQGIPAENVVYIARNGQKPKLKIAARTNSGNLYTLTVHLAEFPETPPPVTLHTMLLDKNGHPLSEPSASMHTLRAIRRKTRICYYHSNAWTPRVSLYKVYIKCLLWLNCYELHLQSGHKMEYYLNHQNS